MIAKTFDCVQMKQMGAEEIRKKIENITKEEEFEFWRNKSKKLKKLQKKINTKKQQSSNP